MSNIFFHWFSHLCPIVATHNEQYAFSLTTHSMHLYCRTQAWIENKENLPVNVRWWIDWTGHQCTVKRHSMNTSAISDATQSWLWLRWWTFASRSRKTIVPSASPHSSDVPRRMLVVLRQRASSAWRAASLIRAALLDASVSRSNRLTIVDDTKTKKTATAAKKKQRQEKEEKGNNGEKSSANASKVIEMRYRCVDHLH